MTTTTLYGKRIADVRVGDTFALPAPFPTDRIYTVSAIAPDWDSPRGALAWKVYFDWKGENGDFDFWSFAGFGSTVVTVDSIVALLAFDDDAVTA